MWWDTAGFNLEQHGDRHEKELWQHHRDRLSGYEAIWRKYVVPLTNRIDTRIAPTDDQWIMLRAISSPWERFAMAHYSTFFYFCRAHALRTAVPQFYEGTINFLRMSTYNLYRFLATCDQLLAQPAGTKLTDLVKHSPVCNTIKLYRDILLKNSVLGRSRTIGRDALPKEAVLNRLFATKKKQDAALGWLEFQQLMPSDFVKAEQLIHDCVRDLTRELQTIWFRVDNMLQPHRTDATYLASVGLDQNGHVLGDTGTVLLLDFSAPAASGDLL